MSKLNQNLLDAIVQKATNRKHIHGAVIQVESCDRSIRFTSASGNILSTSQYYLASINKLIISFITLRLYQDQKLSLSDKVSTFLTEEMMNGLVVYKGVDYASELTICHLISHTSGIPDYLTDKRTDGKKNMALILSGENQSWPLDRVLSEVKQMKSRFRPGSKGKAHYSEANFRLLGKILEIVTQKKIGELITSVFEELGMKDSVVLPSKLATNLVPVYFKENILQIDAYWDSTNHDVASTVDDQMKFIRAFFDGNYLTKETLSYIQQWNTIFFPFSYGIGIQRFYMPRIFSPFKAIPIMIGHCGSVSSVAFYVPEKQVFITGTLNQTSKLNVVFQTLVKILNNL